MSKLEKICLLTIFWGSIAILATPIITYSNIYFPFIFPKGLYFEFLTEILLFTWLILIWKNHAYQPNFRNPLVFLPGIFIFIMFITSLFGLNFERSFFSYQERMTGILLWLHLYAWLIIMISCFKSRKQWLNLIKFSLICSSIIGLNALGQKFQLPWTSKNYSLTPVISGTLGNTIYLGCYCIMHIFLGSLLFFQEKNRVWKIISIFIIIFNLFIATQTGSRGIMIGLFSGILLFAVIEVFHLKNKKYKFFLCGIIIFLILSFVFINTQRNSEWIKNAPYFLQRMSQSAIIDYRRTLAWKAGWEGFLERPLTGWGWENFDSVFDRHFDPWITRHNASATWYDKSHNQLVDILCLTGIFGFLSYLIFYGTYTKKIFFQISAAENTNERRSLQILVSLMVAYFIQNLMVFDTPGILVIFLFVLGLVCHFLENHNNASLPNDKQISNIKNLSSKELRRLSNKIQKKGFSSTNPPILFIITLLLIFTITINKFILQPFKSSKDYIKIWKYRVYKPAETIPALKKLLQRKVFNNYEYNMGLVEFVNSPECRENLTTDQYKEALQMAIDGMEKNISKNPYSSRYYVYLGYLYATGSEFFDTYMNKSIETYKKALEISPKRAEIYYNLIADYLSIQNFEQAYVLAQKALALDELNTDSQSFLGITQIFNNEFELGFSKISDNFYSSRENLAVFAMKKLVQNKKYAEAYQISAKIFENNSQNYEVLMIKSYSAYKISKFSEGLETLKQLKKLDYKLGNQLEQNLKKEKIIK